MTMTAHGMSSSAQAAVGIVQVPRGAHYPSDVLAGVVVGVVAEAVVHRPFPALTATPDR